MFDLVVPRTLQKADVYKGTNRFLRDNLTLIDTCCLTDGNKRIMHGYIDN